MKGKVERSIDIKAPPAAVWRWLASQEALRQWISPNIQ
ncbi:MAG: SRPBCC family protein, partial [Caulobacteraceae bacterium]|nr:SRPBCC family protein [Caulobacteraceae bacterium]